MHLQWANIESMLYVVDAVCRSIQSFVDTYLDQHPKLDCVINNAGVFMPEHKKTPVGFEVCA